jgi:glycosyltransferase involved in cell wall biosynthesis
VFFYHGAMSQGRGLFETLRAFELSRRATPDIAMVLLGDGVARPRLEALARRLGLQRDVAFLDPVPLDRVPEFLGQAGVGLAPWPATWDMEVNCPLKLTEYLCTGLPVVLTRMRAHRIVPDAAPFAFWATASTPPDLADAMVRAARARPDLPRLGAEARAWAMPRLGWSPQFAILEETIRRAAAAAASQETPAGTASRGEPARSRKSS